MSIKKHKSLIPPNSTAGNGAKPSRRLRGILHRGRNLEVNANEGDLSSNETHDVHTPVLR